MRPAPGAAPASPSAARELRQDPDAAARARPRPLARAGAGAAARGRAMGAERRHPGSARDARARARGGGAGGGGARGPRAGAGNGEPPGVARRVGASGAARGGPGDSRAGRPDRAGRASGADAPPPLAAATALPVREARDRGAPYDRGRALRRGARRPRRRGHPGGVLVDCLSFADSTDAVLRVGVGPAKWATGLVVGPDVLYQLAPQIRGRREDAAREAVALDPWMRGEPRGDRLGLMRREVVGNEVDRAAPRVGGHELIEEGQELDTRMPGDRAAFD